MVRVSGEHDFHKRRILYLEGRPDALTFDGALRDHSRLVNPHSGQAQRVFVASLFHDVEDSLHGARSYLGNSTVQVVVPTGVEIVVGQRIAELCGVCLASLGQDLASVGHRPNVGRIHGW